MKRTTTSLLTGALAAGTFIGLATLVPSVASANCAAPTLVTPSAEGPWKLGQAAYYTRADGFVTYNPAGGLDVGVTVNGSTGKATGYYTGIEVPLAGQTAQSNYAITGLNGAQTDPQGFSYQLVIDRDGDAATPGTEILVYEPRYYGVGVWHTNTGGDQLGYRYTGDLAGYSAANPAADIVSFGFSYGSGVPAGSLLVTEVTFGCNIFNFAPDPDAPNVAPSAQLAVTGNTDSDPTSVTFDATGSTDPEDGTTGLNYVFSVALPGGGFSDFPSTTPTYDAVLEPGTYTATVLVTDTDGASTRSAPVTFTVAVPNDGIADGPLPDTGANVLGLAVVGGVAVAGAGSGLVLRSRRRSDSAV